MKGEKSQKFPNVFLHRFRCSSLRQVQGRGREGESERDSILQQGSEGKAREKSGRKYYVSKR